MRRVSFKQFNPNKPAKYGLLFKSINGARYPYSFVSAPYCGKPKSEPTEEYKQGTFEVTKHMVEKLSKYTGLKGRNISFDRLYTSIPLADWLLAKGITSVATLVANRRGLPKEFIKTTEREEFSYKVLWRKDEPYMSLHSYVVKTKSTGKRNVLLLSTLKPLLAVTRDYGKKPPQIYKVHDFTKGGTDITDQRAQYYTCKVKSNRWTIAAFSYILDNSRINASAILALNKKDDPRKVNSLDFGWKLVQNLTTPFIENRSLSGLSSMVQQKMCVILKRKITSRNPSAELFPARNKQRKNAGYVSMIHMVPDINL